MVLNTYLISQSSLTAYMNHLYYGSHRISKRSGHYSNWNSMLGFWKDNKDILVMNFCHNQLIWWSAVEFSAFAIIFTHWGNTRKKCWLLLFLRYSAQTWLMLSSYSSHLEFKIFCSFTSWIRHQRLEQYTWYNSWMFAIVSVFCSAHCYMLKVDNMKLRYVWLFVRNQNSFL